MKSKFVLLYLFILVGLMLIFEVSAENVPWFDSTDGNPYTDSSGNQWAVYQIGGTDGYNSFQKWTLYSLMGWNNNRWEGNNMSVGHPWYGEAGIVGSDYRQVLTSVLNDSGRKQSAMVFTPISAGRYSWTGGMRYLDVSGQSRDSDVIFGKFDDSGGVWTTFYSKTLSSNTVLDLGSISELQNIPLGEGERLVIVNSASYYAAAGFYFRFDAIGTQVGLNLEKNIDFSYVPWLTPSDGNPYKQENGHSWSFHQISPDGVVARTSYQTPAYYHPMTWNAANTRWEGFDMGWGSPYYNTVNNPGSGSFLQRLTAPGRGSGAYRQSAVVYDPNEAGIYSWTGSLRYQDFSGQSRSSTVEFGKFYDDHNCWQTLYSVELSEGQIFNMDSVGSLQNIVLNKGEKLVIVNNTDSVGYYAIAAIFFRDEIRNTRAAVIKEQESAVVKYVPWFDSSDGNPYIDEDNDEWAVYQIGDTIGVNSFLNLRGYTPMSWNVDKWEGFDMAYGHPAYRTLGSKVSGDFKQILTSPGTGAGKWRQSALVYNPIVKGEYSLVGELKYLDWSGSNLPMNITFVKITGDQYSSRPVTRIYTTVMEHSEIIDLSSIPQLQNIYLGDNSSIGIVMQTGYDGFHAAGSLYFLEQGANSVGFVRHNLSPTCCDYDGTICLPTDINRDCQVDIQDIMAFVDVWLDCNNPQGCN